jgi:hypothetical protein
MVGDVQLKAKAEHEIDNRRKLPRFDMPMRRFKNSSSNSTILSASEAHSEKSVTSAASSSSETEE